MTDKKEAKSAVQKDLEKIKRELEEERNGSGTPNREPTPDNVRGGLKQTSGDLKSVLLNPSKETIKGAEPIAERTVGGRNTELKMEILQDKLFQYTKMMTDFLEKYSLDKDLDGEFSVMWGRVSIKRPMMVDKKLGDIYCTRISISTDYEQSSISLYPENLDRLCIEIEGDGLAREACAYLMKSEKLKTDSLDLKTEIYPGPRASDLEKYFLPLPSD